MPGEHDNRTPARPKPARGAKGRRRARSGARPERAHVHRPFTPQQLAQRAAAIPVVVFPDLPVSARRDEIAEAIRDHQVVIVSGETGSGKTTQLPKICLQLGRGVTGMIGHTQPRRLAARSVADRIAAELGQTVGRAPGQVVGYQVRFTDEVGPTTLVKLMTDGILLAEIQSDPMLERYDTLIIDEAHERSLNIDFILGYLARLLPARPDLKVIITSATIDSARFAEHFGRWDGPVGRGRPVEPAPVIEVSGRTFPVEIRYRPLAADLAPSRSSAPTGSDGAEAGAAGPGTGGSASAPAGAGPGSGPTGSGTDGSGAPPDGSGADGAGAFEQLVLEDPDDDLPALGYGLGEDIDVETAICHAVDELSAEGDGDILVFLPGERDIRDTESALLDHLGARGVRAGEDRGALPGSIEILPLYARLTAAEQHRVFEPHRLRRVVLATNVAETSLTVPGIRYVVDPGLARISRYSNRTKVQRLPIEPISQASADQRAGRCGRVADGVAIRLYSQRDYEARPRFTEPEILRTSLASVILQMASLGLGPVEDFPFVDPPERRAVRDGVNLLVEIGALAPDGPSDRGPGRGGRPGSAPRSADGAGDRQGSRPSAAPSPQGTGSGRGAPRRGSARPGHRLTRIGRDLARLPIDPRLGRMLLEADANGCASEVLVIVAALSIQDVRERPAEHQAAADAAHARLADPHSDFVTYVNLWRYLNVQARDLSGSAFRRLCRAEFLHYLRFREWRDVVNQLRQMARPLGIDAGPVGEPPRRDVVEAAASGGAADAAARAVVAFTQGTATVDADQIHRSLLVGLLSNLGSWDESKRDYEGARGTHFTIWPGSGVAGRPAWVMAAELVETSRLFARTVARIRPEWVEPAAGALVKRVHSEPYWSSSKGAAMVKEKVLLYGLTLSADRPVLLGGLGDTVIDEAGASSSGLLGAAPGAGALGAGPLTARALAREMFIRHALVEGEWRERHAFQRANEELVEQAREVERRSRTHGLVADEEARFAFFDDLVPEDVVSAAHFNRWWKGERRSRPDLLTYPRALLLPRGAGEGDGFPDHWVGGGVRLPVSYEFSPGSPRDGVSVRVPVEALARVSDEGADWLVPGMVEELITGTIRALPKAKRRLLAPAPETAARIAQWLADNPSGASPAHDRAVPTRADAREPPAARPAPMHRPARWGASTGAARAARPRSGAGGNARGMNRADRARGSATADPDETATTPARGAAITGAAAATAPARGAGSALAASERADSPQDPGAPQGAPGGAPPAADQGPTGGSAPRRPPFATAFASAVRELRGVELSEEDLAHAAEHLPDHLRMTFVVVDSRGRELGAGKDLAHLQHSLAGAADQAVRRAVRGAIAQAMEDAQAGRGRRGKTAEGTGRATGGGKRGRSDGGRGARADGRTPGTDGGRGTGADGRTNASAGASPSRAGGGAEAAALSALNEDSITAMPVLPRAVTSQADGLSLRAFPALVPQGSADDPRAGVRVMANAAEAAREHRLGLARLLLQRVRLATARVTTRWTGREALMLAASPYEGTDALVADAQLASALSLVDQLCESDSVRSPEDFERLVAAARGRHEDRVYEILGHVVRAMEAHSEAEGAVAAHPQASLREVVDDVRENTRRLVHAGFLADTPFGALPHLARYLRAGAVRIDRASQSAAALDRDLADMDRLGEAARRLDRARQAAAGRPYDAGTARLLSQAQWMAQELRVSLFAQRLGTPNKVSFKRLLGVIADAEAAVRPGGRP